MKITSYFKPDNPFALWIVYALIGVFAFWFGLLLWNVAWNIYYRRQIKRCMEISGLLAGTFERPTTSMSTLSLRGESLNVFNSFLKDKKLKEKSPIAGHLRAIFAAGWNESQLDVRGLIKNTTDALFRANSLHRSLLSIFIILGLLGTLFGLADTLAALEPALRNSAQVNNDDLRLGLNQLLVALKGAFAPSIWGVLLTVAGVLMFAAYVRWLALPLSGLLEHTTLTVWVPQLMPTGSQLLLRRSEQQTRRTLAAAQEVVQFAEDIQHKSGALGETLDLSTAALRQMAQLADRLSASSQNFVEGLKPLKPFQEQLQALYQQMLNESRAFQQSVQSNIASSQDFQQRIQGQLNSQNQQLERVLHALNSYETAYVANRGEIDKKLGEVLEKAEQAFQHLSQRNEEIGEALDDALGKPLRANLAQHLGAVDASLQAKLGAVDNTLEVALRSLSDRLRELDKPLNDAAEKFTNTFSNFNQYTDEWRTELQREFVQQNETNQQQLQRLEILTTQLPAVLQQLSASSENFSTTSSSFAARGEQLSQDVATLSQSIAVLGRSVDTLGEQFTAQPAGGNDERTAEVLAQQTRVLQELANRLERISSTRARARTEAVIVSPGGAKTIGDSEVIAPPKLRWRDRFRNWYSFGRGRDGRR